jgi:putative membrane protein
MIYLLFKTIHIGSVIVWVGGMLLLAFTTSVASRLPPPSQPDERSIVKAAVRWDRSVTAPAMALAWLCGLTIALQGKWFPTPWLLAKLVLVVLLAALHGYQSGSLRRLSAGGVPAAPALRYAPGATLVCMLSIVALVVFKP